MTEVLGYHVFPRDADLPADAYRRLRIPWGWMSLVDLLCAEAKLLGIQPSPATQARLLRGVAGFFFLDRLLDASWQGSVPASPEAVALFHRLMDGDVNERDLPEWVVTDEARTTLAVRMLRNSLTTEPMRSEVMDHLRLAGDIAPAKIAAANIFAYVRFVAEEDRHTTLALIECFSAAEQAHPAFKSYRRWCVLFSIAAGLADSVVDLGKDRRLGLVTFRPIGGRTVLAASTLALMAWMMLRYPIRAGLVFKKAGTMMLTQRRWLRRAEELRKRAANA